MENIPVCLSRTSNQPTRNSFEQAGPFSQEWVTIPKAEQLSLIHQANYWKAQHTQIKQKLMVLEEDNQRKDAKIKDLQNRLLGKKSEKQGLAKSAHHPPSCKRKRGQQPGSAGHGRTPRPDFPVISQTHDLAEDDKRCACCGLPYLPNPALDECNDFIEVKVHAYTRRVRRPAYYVILIVVAMERQR